VWDSPNDFEITRRKYKSHTVFDQTDMHAYVEVGTAVRSIRNHKGKNIDFVGDNSSYYEFYLIVKPNMSNSTRQEKFWLDFTPLHFGGWRYWLKCLECRRRKTKLYVEKDRVACMDCLGLIYPTKTGSKDSALVRLYKHRKAIELLQTRRQMMYAGKPTRIGRQFQRYYDNLEGLKIT
jgi:hypothetical protein